MSQSRISQQPIAPKPTCNSKQMQSNNRHGWGGPNGTFFAVFSPEMPIWNQINEQLKDLPFGDNFHTQCESYSIPLFPPQYMGEYVHKYNQFVKSMMNNNNGRLLLDSDNTAINGNEQRIVIKSLRQRATMDGIQRRPTLHSHQRQCIVHISPNTTLFQAVVSYFMSIVVYYVIVCFPYQLLQSKKSASLN
jgi:hypothetical protein